MSIVCLGCLGPTPILLLMAILYSFPVPGSLASLATALTAAIWPPLAPSGAPRRSGRESRRSRSWRPPDARAQPWALLLAGICLNATRPLDSDGAGQHRGDRLGSHPRFLGRRRAGRLASLGQLLRTRLALNRAGAGHAFRYIGAAAAGLSVLLVGLRMIQGWVEGLRVARTVQLEDVVEVEAEGPGWVVTVWHRATGTPLGPTRWIPYRPGGLTVVAGGSGSGKSLAMAAMAGLLPSDLACRVIAVGDAPRGPWLRVVYVPQALQDNFGSGTRVDQYVRAIGLPRAAWAGYLSSFGLNSDSGNDNGLRDNCGRWKTATNRIGRDAQRFALALALLPSRTCSFSMSRCRLDECLAAKIGPLLRRRLEDNPQLGPPGSQPSRRLHTAPSNDCRVHGLGAHGMGRRGCETFRPSPRGPNYTRPGGRLPEGDADPGVGCEEPRHGLLPAMRAGFNSTRRRHDPAPEGPPSGDRRSFHGSLTWRLRGP